MWVQVPSSARKTQVVRLESFCVTGEGDKVSLIDKDENNIRTESLPKVGFRSFYKIVNKKKYATRISCGKMILG